MLHCLDKVSSTTFRKSIKDENKNRYQQICNSSSDDLFSVLNFEKTLKWLVYRQSVTIEENEKNPSYPSIIPQTNIANDSVSLDTLNALPVDYNENFAFVGFNGRCNKAADTCYTFWVGASLAVGLSFLV